MKRIERVRNMPEKHTCKFKLIKYKSGNRLFFCTLPDCNKKINPALALGKRCICWRCGNEFFLSEYSLRLVKPHCENCHKSKGKQVEVLQTSMMDDKFDEPVTISLADRLQSTIRSKSEEKDEGEI